MVPPGGNTRERNRGRAVTAGGQSTSYTTSIQIFNIQSQGNTVEVGELSQNNWGLGACGSSTRGLFGGGRTSPGGSGNYLNTIEFVTIANAGNSSDFGDLTRKASYINSLGNETRGIWAGGYDVDTKPATNIGQNTMDYVTVASTGNAADFGNMTVARAAGGDAGHSSETRALLAAGSTPSSDANDTIDFITIASTGNGVDFGNLTQSVSGIIASGNATRGLLSGGSYLPSYAYRNTIDVVTIATTGNAVDFGFDLTTAGGGRCCDNSVRALYQVAAGDNKQIETVIIATLSNSFDFGELTQTNDGGSFGTSDPTRGLFGLNTPSGGTNIMEYISMSAGGTAVDFGDLTQAITNSGATSNAHGGL